MDDLDDDRRALTRVVRQHLEALRRAGVDRLPLPTPWLARPAGGSKPTPTVARPSPTPTRAPAPPIARPPVVATVPPDLPPPRPVVPARPSSLFEEPGLEVLVPEGERGASLAALAAEVAGCVRCPHLASTRTQTVFGEGSPTARLMFVGEAPGADEDRTGRPFVGRAGALLTDMITKGMGLDRAEVYIANILKSRPPENRTPLPHEVENCLPYLERQIATIRPEFLCLLGKTAASALLETSLPLGRLRGKWHRYRGIPAIVTYHPSALLRNPAWKADAWADLKILMNAMGLKAPERKKPG